MKFCNVFYRFSFNIFALAAPVTFALTYIITSIIGLIIQLKYDYPAGESVFALTFIIFAISQYLTLLLTIWLVFKEINRDFRIKNPKLLNIVNNNFYRTTAVILFFTEIFFQKVGFDFFDVVESFF